MLAPYSRFVSLLVVALIAFSSLGAVLPALAQETATETHGIQLADMDLAADPDANFYRFANGGWLDRTEIPGDQPSYGVFEELNDLTEQQLLDLLADLSQGGDLQEGSDEWKAVQLFAQALDLDARNEKGVAPVQPILDEIDAIQDLDGLHAFLVDAKFKGINGLFTFDVYSDLEDSTIWSGYLFGPELWLPNRDYYLEDDATNQAIREAYVATLAQMLGYAGYDEVKGLTAGQAVYDFEKRLAEPTFTREEQQDYSLMNVRMTVDELETSYPLLDWAAYMEARGLSGVERVIVGESRYLAALGQIVEETPLDAIKDTLKLQLLWTNRAYLGEDIQTTSFDFRGRVLSGTQQEPPIEERALDVVNGLLGEAVGKLYVERHFPPEAKAQIEDLIAQLIEAFGHRLDRNTWMSAEAKAEAQDKLSKIIVKAGYPDTWRSYDEVTIEDSYAATVQSATNAEYRRFLARVGQPVDKTEWFTPPQVVNAFYDPSENSISFPAAILQSPFFDYQADPASNYGAIGMVIGHEITHGYDLGGSQFDADGNLRSWWTEEDAANFQTLNDRTVEQYGAIEVLPDLFVDGQITVGENVADMGGVQVAYEAMQNTLDRTERPDRIDGFTQEQRFYIAAAQVWRAKIRPEYLTTWVKSAEHTPSAIRSVQPIRQMGAFHLVFDIRPDDPMFLPPEDRIVIW